MMIVSAINMVVIATSFASLVQGNCKTKRSQSGFGLQNSAYSTLQVADYPTCLSWCQNDPSRCKSLTFDSLSKICLLSSESRWSKPWAYKSLALNIYMEMLGVAEVLNTDQPPITPEAATSEAATPEAATPEAATQETATQEAATQAPTVTFNPSVFCADKVVGDYVHPSDCHSYITCADGGSGFSRPCGAGMNFNPEHMTCDFIAKVVCL